MGPVTITDSKHRRNTDLDTDRKPVYGRGARSGAGVEIGARRSGRVGRVVPSGFKGRLIGISNYRKPIFSKI